MCDLSKVESDKGDYVAETSAYTWVERILALQDCGTRPKPVEAGDEGG